MMDTGNGNAAVQDQGTLEDVVTKVCFISVYGAIEAFNLFLSEERLRM